MTATAVAPLVWILTEHGVPQSLWPGFMVWCMKMAAFCKDLAQGPGFILTPPPVYVSSTFYGEKFQIYTAAGRILG